MKKILLIEDQGIIRLSFLIQLNANGFNAVGAESGETGLHLVREFAPHLIVSNFDLPRMSGYDVLREVRGNQTTAQIPFIFLSGRSIKTLPDQEILLQANAYLDKPIIFKELLQEIVKLLGLEQT